MHIYLIDFIIWLSLISLRIALKFVPKMFIHFSLRIQGSHIRRKFLKFIRKHGLIECFIKMFRIRTMSDPFHLHRHAVTNLPSLILGNFIVRYLIELPRLAAANLTPARIIQHHPINWVKQFIKWIIYSHTFFFVEDWSRIYRF